MSTGRLKPIQVYMQKNNSNFIERKKSDHEGLTPYNNVYANTEPKNNNFKEQNQKGKTVGPAVYFYNQSQSQIKKNQYQSNKNLQRKQLSPKQKGEKKSQDKKKLYKRQNSLHLGKQTYKKIQRILAQQVTPTKKSKSKKKQQDIEEDYERSQRILKLYAKHQQKMNNLSQVQAKRAYQQFSQLKDFKVSNKVSIFLNQKNKKNQKPLYQRSQEIVQTKQKKLLQIRMKKANEEMKAVLQQEEEAIKVRETRSKRVAWQEIQKKMEEMKAKQKQRQNKKNAQRINIVKKISRNYRQKPQISPISKKIFQKIMNQNDYPRDFLKRNQKYQVQRKISAKERQEKYQAQYTPFHPQLTQTTREITKNRQTNAFLTQKSISPSKSCKCLKKGVNLNSPLIKKDKEQIKFVHNKSVDNLKIQAKQPKK